MITAKTELFDLLGTGLVTEANFDIKHYSQFFIHM